MGGAQVIHQDPTQNTGIIPDPCGPAGGRAGALTSPYVSTAGFQRCFRPRPSQSYTIITISTFLPNWDGERGRIRQDSQAGPGMGWPQQAGLPSLVWAEGTSWELREGHGLRDSRNMDWWDGRMQSYGMGG